MEPCREMHEEDFSFPEWQRPLLLALRETDHEKLKERVEEAETAIYQRQQTIAPNSDHRTERQALEDAMNTLRVLKRDLRPTDKKSDQE